MTTQAILLIDPEAGSFLFIISSSLLLKLNCANWVPSLGERGGAINGSLRGSAEGPMSRETKAPGIESADLGVHLPQETSFHSTAH